MGQKRIIYNVLFLFLYSIVYFLEKNDNYNANMTIDKDKEVNWNKFGYNNSLAPNSEAQHVPPKSFKLQLQSTASG